MPKNIVVLSDGTGQEGGKGHDTNVYKLFRMLEDRTDKQVVFYDEGLGTDWRKITGSAFGVGFSKNLLQCYQFIFDNYESEDRIFLFGFSRGAATVRSLSSFIQYFGILPKSRPELVGKAYKLYEKGRETFGANFFKQTWARFRHDEDSDILNDQAEEFIKEHPNQWANIEFMGVWDTVPALGFVAVAGLNTFLGKALKYNFHDFRLHPRVRNAYHALSIDDDRLWFHPSLWREKSREDQTVEQVWFSGAHTDVGGGFKKAGLSDIALEWMVEKAVHHGLRLYLRSRKYWNFVIAPDATDEYHPPRAGVTKIFKKGPRNDVWATQGSEHGKEDTAEAGFGAPVIHDSVLKRHIRSKDKQQWILDKTNKSTDPGFKEFLRRKFYDYLKYEWKKYDWKENELKKDESQAKEFDDWIGAALEYKGYKESYDWDMFREHLEKGYKDFCKRHWQKDGIELPVTRNQWLENNPYKNEKNLDPNWIEDFPPYQRWYDEHTRNFGGIKYYVEPEREVDVALFDPESVKNGEKPRFRDYDEDTIKEVIDDIRDKINEQIELSMEGIGNRRTVSKIGDEDTPETILQKIEQGEIRIPISTENYNFLKRGRILKDKFNRFDYDLERWAGKDDEYNKKFDTKG